MTINTSKLTALSLAFAVWLTYSVPANAGSRANHPGKASAGLGLQGDDDDEGFLSGGALAVLLLAIGGAVAGVLYAGRAPGGIDGISCKRLSDELTVTMRITDETGKPTRAEWKAKLDQRSGTIKLTKGGSPTQWLGKGDGKYYPVTGLPAAHDFAFTKIDANTMEFTIRQAGRVTVTGRMVVSPNGRSVTFSTDHVNSAGHRVLSQLVFTAH